jgi:DNA primase
MELDATLEEIKGRLDMPRVFGRYVQKMKKQGRQYIGLCPFHGEKTPSFSIDPDRGLYHCFGCGVRGNLFQFLQEQTGLGFIDVVRGLAEETGVEMPQRDESPRAKERRLRREKQTAILEKTQLFFRNCLRAETGKVARAYIEKRGVPPELVERFGLGFGGSEPQSFLRFLERENISQDDAIEAGVIRVNERGPFPFFYGRLCFPIRDHRGRIVSFSARAFGDRKPKYVNGPATDVFDKSRELFGYYEALKTLRRGRPAVLVEGQLDVIALHRAGVESAVAPCGTSLTERHAEKLKKACERVILCLDDDEAGRKAAARSALLLLRQGFEVGLVELDGGDPDDLVNAGEGEKLRTAIEGARDAVEVFIERARIKAGSSVRARTRAIDALLPYLAAPPREIVRRALIRLAAEKLGEDEDVLRKEVERAGREQPRAERPQREQPARREGAPPPEDEGQRHRPAPAPQRPSRPPWRPAERLLAKALLAHPLLVPRCGVLTEGLRNAELKGFIERLSEAVVRHHELPPQEVLQKVPLERESEIFSLVRDMFQSGGFQDPERYFAFSSAAQTIEDFLMFHDKRPIAARLVEVQRAIEAAEEAGDDEARIRLQKQHMSLREERNRRRDEPEAVPALQAAEPEDHAEEPAPEPEPAPADPRPDAAAPPPVDAFDAPDDPWDAYDEF